MLLTNAEIGVILSALQTKYGFGYSDAKENEVNIGQLQAKLSIMAEMTANTPK